MRSDDAQMTLELDALLFDAGGTLFDMRPSKEEIFAEALSGSGRAVDAKHLARSIAKAERSLDEEFARIEGGDERTYWLKYDRMVLTDIGFDGDFESMSSLLSSRYKEIVEKVESWVDYPETKPVLERLRRTDLRLGMVSNASGLLRKVLDNLDLARYFDFILVSSEVGFRKPDPEIFRMAARRAGTAPNRAVFIGDRLATDVMGATRAGMNAILLDRADAYPDCKCIRKRDLNFLLAYT